MMKLNFKVVGIPKPGGSKRTFFNKKTGKGIIVDTCKKVKQWRDTVISIVSEVYTGAPLPGPIKLDITFHMPRPQHHYGTGKNKSILKFNAPKYHICVPDRTKLLRSTEDALTKILWRNDSQIVAGNIIKLYTNTQPGADIYIEELDEQ